MLLHDQYLNIAYVRACRAGFEEPAHLFKKGVRIVFGQKTRGIEIERLGAPDGFCIRECSRGIGGAVIAIGAGRKEDDSSQRGAQGSREM